jgi:hypothetical protein
MKKYLFSTLLFILVSCEPNPTVKPNYIVDDIRPLGMKAEPVEAVAGDLITLSLLIGGRTFSQDSDLKISWLGLEELSVPYTQPLVFPLPENFEELMPDDQENPQIALFIENFNRNGFADLPVAASFKTPVPTEKKERTLTVTKTIRIYKEAPKEGVRLNPVIDHVLVSREKDKKIENFEVKNSEVLAFAIDDMPETLVFRSIPLLQEETGWDRLNFAWFFTSDNNELLENDMEVELDRKKYGDMVPDDEKATQNREYFALSFKPVIDEIKKKKIKLPSTFSFYHIIRDKAVNAQSSEDYRWGQDFIWFEIEITEEE